MELFLRIVSVSILSSSHVRVKVLLGDPTCAVKQSTVHHITTCFDGNTFDSARVSSRSACLCDSFSGCEALTLCSVSPVWLGSGCGAFVSFGS